MMRLRRALGPIAAAWLVCQMATMTLAPAVLWTGSAQALLECLCTHGDHAICPMHHKPAPSSKLCLMKSANDTGLAVLSSVLGTVGLAPVPTQVVAPVPELSLFLIDITTPSPRSTPPDPPPPRA